MEKNGIIQAEVKCKRDFSRAADVDYNAVVELVKHLARISADNDSQTLKKK